MLEADFAEELTTVKVFLISVILRAVFEALPNIQLFVKMKFDAKCLVYIFQNTSILSKFIVSYL